MTALPMGNRSATFRMIRIEQHLKKNKYGNLRELADLLEVSQRTVQRDLETMRDLLGAPVIYDRYHKGYYYGREFVLPRIDLTEGELVALFLTEKLLSYLEGTPYAVQLASAGTKLRLLLTDKTSGDAREAARTRDYISIASEPLRGDELRLAKFFACLETARRQGRRVEHAYYSIQREEASVRKLDPYHLHLWEGSWYVIGYCHLRCAVRTFALDRVQEIRILDEKFRVPPDFKIEDYLRNCWGIERGAPARVQIRFDAHQARWIRERIWHPSQSLRELSEGRLLMEVEVAGWREIKQWVLGFGAHAEILEPAELREEIRREIMAMTEVYQ